MTATELNQSKEALSTLVYPNPAKAYKKTV